MSFTAAGADQAAAAAAATVPTPTAAMAPTPAGPTRLDTVRHYLVALARAAQGDELARFFTPDALQIEYPNRLNPHGGCSDLATLLQRAARVPELIASQRYDIVSETAQDQRVVVEATWTGVLATAFRSVAAGTALTAHFAMVFEFDGLLIRRQRNYDCFEAW